MTGSVSGQSVVVVGGANGIGAAIRDAFHDGSARVTVLDRDRETLERIRSDLQEIETVVADVSSLASLESAAEGREIDHLVVAAATGSGREARPFWKMSPEHWDPVVDITLLGTVRAVHAFTPGLLRGNTERKSVLLLSSVAGQIGSPTDPPYSAAKAAVINFAQCAAKDFAPHGIRVNTIAPGMVRTDLNRSVYEAVAGKSGQSYDEWADEKIARVSPLGRWQEASEVAAMSVFLASDAARNITGQTINIDGGQVMRG